MALEEVLEEDVLVVELRGFEARADLAHVALEVRDVVVRGGRLHRQRAAEQRLGFEGLLQAGPIRETGDCFNLRLLHRRVGKKRFGKEGLLVEQPTRERQRAFAHLAESPGRLLRLLGLLCRDCRQLEERHSVARPRLCLQLALPVADFDPQVVRQLG